MSDQVYIGARQGRSITITDERSSAEARFRWPGDGEWVLCPMGGVQPFTGQEVAPCAAVVRIESGALVATLRAPTEAEFRPVRDITLQEVQTFVDGLSGAQLRRVVARLIYLHREDLPEDIRARFDG